VCRWLAQALRVGRAEIGGRDENFADFGAADSTLLLDEGRDCLRAARQRLCERTEAFLEKSDLNSGFAWKSKALSGQTASLRSKLAAMQGNNPTYREGPVQERPIGLRGLRCSRPKRRGGCVHCRGESGETKFKPASRPKARWLEAQNAIREHDLPLGRMEPWRASLKP